jgi:hypothetical protein
MPEIKMKNQLILPMVIYVLYMGLVAVYMFLTRVNNIKGGAVKMRYFKTYPAEDLPERMIVTSRHYDNQFQVPILFLVAGAMHFSMGMVNSLTLFLAWGFVASRALHAIIHLGSNHIPKRAAFFAMGWIFVTALWLQLGYFSVQ